MKIEKLANKIELDVEAQKLPCNADCPGGYVWTGNTSGIGNNGMPTNCHIHAVWTSFISTKH